MGVGGAFNYTYYSGREMVDGRVPDIGQGLKEFKVGALFAGFLPVGVKAISQASPFVKNAFSKISSGMADNIKIGKIAFNNMGKGPKSVVLGSNLGNADEALGRFSKEFEKAKNGIAEGAGNRKIYDPIPSDSYAQQQYKKILMKDDIISNSNQIINGEKLWDQKARDILTNDGSNIGDWWKMESKYSYSTEFGEGKIHYYQNVNTGNVSTFDSKLKVPKPKNLRADSKDLFWIIDLDKNFVPNKMR